MTEPTQPLLVCRHCHEAKPPEQMITSRDRPIRHCRVCYNARQCAKRAADPERYRAYQAPTPERRAEWRERRRLERQANPERQRAWNRRAYLKRTYGITPEDFLALAESQDRRCAICREIPTVGRHDGLSLLHVDHDHETGAIRGLLCTRCNRMVGLAHDRPEVLDNAARYLNAALRALAAPVTRQEEELVH